MAGAKSGTWENLINRNHDGLFPAGSTAGLAIPKRLVRSATWDLSILSSRQMTGEVLDLYRNWVLGGVGMIITGGLPVYREGFPGEDMDAPTRLYADLRVNGLNEMVQVVHHARQECKIIAQLETEFKQKSLLAMTYSPRKSPSKYHRR